MLHFEIEIKSSKASRYFYDILLCHLTENISSEISIPVMGACCVIDFEYACKLFCSDQLFFLVFQLF